MEKFTRFREVLLGIGLEELGPLCEKFIYNHDAGIQSTLNIVEGSCMVITKEEIKDFITNMHRSGDFDDVTCFDLPLYNNNLYKQWHSDNLSRVPK